MSKHLNFTILFRDLAPNPKTEEVRDQLSAALDCPRATWDAADGIVKVNVPEVEVEYSGIVPDAVRSVMGNHPTVAYVTVKSFEHREETHCLLGDSRPYRAFDRHIDGHPGRINAPLESYVTLYLGVLRDYLPRLRELLHQELVNTAFWERAATQLAG